MRDERSVRVSRYSHSWRWLAILVAGALTAEAGWAQLPSPEPGPTPSLWITPKGGTASGVADGAVRSVYFNVLNGDVATTWSFRCSAQAPASCAGVSPTSLALSASGEGTVRVDYRATVEGTGRVTLEGGTYDWNDVFQVSDSGYYVVTLSGPLKPRDQRVAAPRRGGRQAPTAGSR